MCQDYVRRWSSGLASQNMLKSQDINSDHDSETLTAGIKELGALVTIDSVTRCCPASFDANFAGVAIALWAFAGALFRKCPHEHRVL